MPRYITINGRKIAEGKHALVNLQIAKLPTHTVIDLPVYVYRGRRDGPVLLISSGIHGDELNGVETVRRMITGGSIVPDSGTVIAIPIVNVYGFLNNSRYLPDGRDLNRCFPGTKAGSLAGRIAWTLINDVIPIVDFGIDLHTGGANVNYPHIRCDTGLEQNMELAHAFAPPFIINSPLRDGSFRKAAQRKGKPILVYEGGESLRFDEFAISECINGILRLMDYLKMTDNGAPERNDTKIITKNIWTRAGSSGLYRPHVRGGDRVKKGQLLASITDPFGEAEIKMKAREGGYAIGLRSVPVVNKGDALINIGMEDA
ncbi:MAG: succinylglutamate desuccinylase/aspartoacylase family protein [Deltaproteobacteria bacterium]